MGNRGRLIAPGGLRDELAEVADDEPAVGESLAEMAAQYGLRPSSARPGLVSYLARGVPVVTTPLPAAAELTRGHECGFVVAFGDVAAAAEAVLELDRDFPLRAKMGRRGHEAAYSSLGWPSDAREFVAQLELWAKSGSGGTL